MRLPARATVRIRIMSTLTSSTLTIAALATALLGAACGKGGDKHELAPLDLGATGYVVDAPKGWTVESPMKGFYSFKGGKGPQIMESSLGVKPVDEVKQHHCGSRTIVDSGTLPNGGVFVACKGESEMIKGVTTTMIVVHVPYANGDMKSLSCNYETDADAAEPLAICKSMRKK
jgi:hypothetical protein